MFARKIDYGYIKIWKESLYPISRYHPGIHQETDQNQDLWNCIFIEQHKVEGRNTQLPRYKNKTVLINLKERSHLQDLEVNEKDNTKIHLALLCSKSKTLTEMITIKPSNPSVQVLKSLHITDAVSKWLSHVKKTSSATMTSASSIMPLSLFQVPHRGWCSIWIIQKCESNLMKKTINNVIRMHANAFTTFKTMDQIDDPCDWSKTAANTT